MSAGQAVILLRATRACGEFKKLSNQFKERGSVHGPLGHDALTPAKRSTKPLAILNNIWNTTCGRAAVPVMPWSALDSSKTNHIPLMLAICISLRSVKLHKKSQHDNNLLMSLLTHKKDNGNCQHLSLKSVDFKLSQHENSMVHTIGAKVTCTRGTHRPLKISQRCNLPNKQNQARILVVALYSHASPLV